MYNFLRSTESTPGAKNKKLAGMYEKYHIEWIFDTFPTKKGDNFAYFHSKSEKAEWSRFCFC